MNSAKHDFGSELSGHLNPLQWLKNAHKDQLKLCETLEALADGLPKNVDKASCLQIAKRLGPLIKEIHAFEEDVFFPWLEAKHKTNSQLRATLERLKFEHIEDECFAEELSETLTRIGIGQDVENPDAAGYMLRGFFEAMRRHIAFEREHLIALAEQQ